MMLVMSGDDFSLAPSGLERQASGRILWAVSQNAAKGEATRNELGRSYLGCLVNRGDPN